MGSRSLAPFTQTALIRPRKVNERSSRMVMGPYAGETNNKRRPVENGKRTRKLRTQSHWPTGCAFSAIPRLEGPPKLELKSEHMKGAVVFFYANPGV